MNKKHIKYRGRMCCTAHCTQEFFGENQFHKTILQKKANLVHFWL